MPKIDKIAINWQNCKGSKLSKCRKSAKIPKSPKMPNITKRVKYHQKCRKLPKMLKPKNHRECHIPKKMPNITTNAKRKWLNAPGGHIWLFWTKWPGLQMKLFRPMRSRMLPNQIIWAVTLDLFHCAMVCVYVCGFRHRWFNTHESQCTMSI